MPPTRDNGTLQLPLPPRPTCLGDSSPRRRTPTGRPAPTGIADGRIRYREDFVDGLEKAPEAFIGMLEGRNFGKLIVRVDGSRPSREQS